MEAKDFVHWMRGFVACINSRSDKFPSESEWCTIQDTIHEAIIEHRHEMD